MGSWIPQTLQIILSKLFFQNYWKAGDKINLNEFSVTKAQIKAFKEWLPPAPLGKFSRGGKTNLTL